MVVLLKTANGTKNSVFEQEIDLEDILGLKIK